MRHESMRDPQRDDRQRIMISGGFYRSAIQAYPGYRRLKGNI
jgi:hypothetical protein